MEELREHKEVVNIEELAISYMYEIEILFEGLVKKGIVGGVWECKIGCRKVVLIQPLRGIVYFWSFFCVKN